MALSNPPRRLAVLVAAALLTALVVSQQGAWSGLVVIGLLAAGFGAGLYCLVRPIGPRPAAAVLAVPPIGAALGAVFC